MNDFNAKKARKNVEEFPEKEHQQRLASLLGEIEIKSKLGRSNLELSHWDGSTLGGGNGLFCYRRRDNYTQKELNALEKLGFKISLIEKMQSHGGLIQSLFTRKHADTFHVVSW